MGLSFHSFYQTYSLDAPIYRGAQTTFADVLAAPEEKGPEEQFRRKFDYEPVRRALGRLPYRERIVLLLRFGIFDGEEWKLKRISALLGLTKERVRQLEAVALTRIRGVLATGSVPQLTFNSKSGQVELVKGRRHPQRRRAQEATA